MGFPLHYKEYHYPNGKVMYSDLTIQTMHCGTVKICLTPHQTDSINFDELMAIGKELLFEWFSDERMMVISIPPKGEVITLTREFPSYGDFYDKI